VNDRAPTVVLADDHAATRIGIRMSLEDGGFTVVAEADAAAAAVDAALREQPDLCLLDVYMPGGGIMAAAEIHARLPGTRIVMLTVSAGEDDLFAALRAGAVGYLLKDTNPERLPFALRGVLEGEAALPRTLVARVIDEFREGEGRRRRPELEGVGHALTDRERDVLLGLRDGRTTADIAQALSISPVTVRRHVSEVLRKLQVPDREAAVRLMRAGRS
jgi:DNA-binding NarL/FixJ family response regulator